ncbi:AI-2E family transporter [Sulfitobacter sp. HNIBRBA3233]|uniref:AI-2E family transporter n=1 Tax=Sulfitobacter marinivivus TaxID=3158558 RepID=UPI0032DF3AED
MEDIGSIRRSLQLLCLIAVFVTAYFAKDLILPIILGFLLALTLSPVARSLGRAGIPSGVSAVLLVGLAGVVILALAAASAGTIASWSDELPRMGAELQAKLRGMSDTVKDVQETTEKVGKLNEAEGPEAPQKVVVEQPGLLASAMSSGAKVGGTIMVTLILALFLLSSGNLFYIKLVQSFQTFTGKKRALAAVYDVEKRVSRYLLTITVINAALGLCVGTYLFAIGLPGWYIFGILAFLLNYLPYIGAAIGIALTAAYAVINLDPIGYALLAPLGYAIFTTVEGNFVTPYLVGRRLRMNTVAVFLTVVIWGWLWGVAGALVAVPFLVVFKVVCENVSALKIIGNFLEGSAPDLSEKDLGADEAAEDEPATLA